MLVAVLSDTHLRHGQTLPPWVWEYIENVDLILHAGDITTPELLLDLKNIAPVEAVQGNCDGWELTSLPDKKVITCGDLRIGLTHGAFGKGRNTPERALSVFQGESVDAVVFGHSHIPYMEWEEGILLFNPGSPTDKRREPKYSIGILEVDGKEIKGRHIFY